MESLVADYSSSSDDSDEKESHDHAKTPTTDKSLFGLFGCDDEGDAEVDDEEEEERKGSRVCDELRPGEAQLPKPSFNATVDELSGAASGVSVFANPFKAAEDAQKCVLEKHVKMTSAPKQSQQINGKQVCWNYRKGRCRFGHNCKFAHDSDLPAPYARKQPSEGLEKNLIEESHTIVRKPSMLAEPLAQGDAEEDNDGAVSTKKRRKCGLGDGLTPSKRVMKMHQRHSKEWAS